MQGREKWHLYHIGYGVCEIPVTRLGFRKVGVRVSRSTGSLLASETPLSSTAGKNLRDALRHEDVWSVDLAHSPRELGFSAFLRGMDACPQAKDAHKLANASSGRRA